MAMKPFSVVVLLFAVSMGLYVLQAMATAPHLTKLHSAVAKGAVCLDGSPPAYQLDWGENEGANHWLLHIEEYGIYYRGGRIFDAIMDELLKMGMNNATSALLSGCSAGGLAAILHCDKFHDLLPPTTNVKCLSDAGYFLINASGSNNHEMFYSQLAQLHGSATHLPPSCTSKMKANLCFNAQNVVPDICTPIFLLNSAYDTFQVASILLPKELSDRNETSCKYDLRKCPAGQLEKWESKFLKFFDTQSHSSKFIIWTSIYVLIFVTFLFFPVLYHAPFILYVPML